METEILEQLIQIKWIALSLFVATALLVLFLVLTTMYRVRAQNSRALLNVRDNYLAELSLLEAKGDFEKLLDTSNEMLVHFPSDLMANWHNALANQKMGQLGAALSACGRIQSISKSWSQEAVEALILDIKTEMKGPRAHDA